MLFAEMAELTAAQTKNRKGYQDFPVTLHAHTSFCNEPLLSMLERGHRDERDRFVATAFYVNAHLGWAGSEKTRLVNN